MKKALSLILALVMCLSLCACGTPNDKNLAEILCTGGWISTDHALHVDTINREVRYTSVRFLRHGTCELVCEDYKNDRLVDTSVIVKNWKIENGKIAISPDLVDSDSDTIYLQYADNTLNGSAWYDDHFTYTHVSDEEITAIASNIVSHSVGLEYVHNGDDTCTVGGMGTCRDKKIIIPAYFEDSEVTAISKAAFGPWYITSIVIPDTVTYIGRSAFLKCEDLTYVSIGNGVTSIDELAFSYCTSLYSIDFEGTMAQWSSISKADDWDYGSNIGTIRCTDGDIKN